MTTMIHRNNGSWQKALTESITNPQDLFALLNLDMQYLPDAVVACNTFPLRVPRSFIDRIEKGNIDDPLLRQILPLGAELLASQGFSNDPLAEKQSNPLPGLLHKYHGRALLMISGACAINCRYCFRRTFSYADNNPGSIGWDKVIDYLASDSSISEIIYSGGDPLTANDIFLSKLTAKIASIPHIKRLRIHTRLPVMIPERICDSFIDWFSNCGLRCTFVIHCNHPNELCPEIKEKLLLLHAKGITLLNQAVLLRGINDNAETLIKLSEKLFAYQVLPYYLHILDPVQGTAHFDVPENKALELLKIVQSKLPGYLVPKLVREVAGKASKVLLI